MTADLWPCRCGADGVRNLGVHGYCATCLGELLASFDPSVFQLSGVWLQDGPMRPDIGPGWAECRCLACGATATTVVGMACGWCIAARERMAAWQADKVLTPPDVDENDVRRPAALHAWARRLAVAVEAGIIDERDARRAWNRAVSHDLAA